MLVDELLILAGPCQQRKLRELRELEPGLYELLLRSPDDEWRCSCPALLAVLQQYAPAHELHLPAVPAVPVPGLDGHLPVVLDIWKSSMCHMLECYTVHDLRVDDRFHLQRKLYIVRLELLRVSLPEQRYDGVPAVRQWLYSQPGERHLHSLRLTLPELRRLLTVWVQLLHQRCAILPGPRQWPAAVHSLRARLIPSKQ